MSDYQWIIDIIAPNDMTHEDLLQLVAYLAETAQSMEDTTMISLYLVLKSEGHIPDLGDYWAEILTIVPQLFLINQLQQIVISTNNDW